MRLGMKATITLDAYPALQLPAALVGIGAMSKTSTFRANFVGEIPVRLKIAGIDPRLLPDLTGSADVILAVEPNAVIAPRAAVLSDESGSFVYVQTQEGWKRQKVDLGLGSFTDIAVHSGIQKGDVLAIGRTLIAGSVRNRTNGASTRSSRRVTSARRCTLGHCSRRRRWRTPL